MTFQLIKEAYISLSQGKHYYQIIGDLNAFKRGETPFIFLHEALGSIPQWKNFPEKLCLQQGAWAILYERLGHGKSDSFYQKRDKNYLHYEAFEILPQIVQYFGLKKVSLVGHSDGASIALIYASQYPVQSIISIAAHIYVEPITIEGIEKTISVYKLKLQKLLENYHGSKTKTLFEAWHKIWLSPSFRDWSIESSLKEIKSPCLLIQGQKDPYATLDQLEDISKKIINSNTYISSSSKHHPHLEETSACLEEIKKFQSLYS